MAATVTNPWGTSTKLGAGAWARDSEEHEDELMEQHKQEIEKKTADFPSLSAVAASDFPSLSAAATAKTKKKKPQTMNLSEFHNPTPAVKLTTEDLLKLPTGPREWTAEELDRSKLGGGFRSRYGDESSTSRWASGRGSGSDEPRRGGFGRDESAPSRADEVDDWGSAKKPLASNGFDRRDRGERGGFFGSDSKADESDSWVSKKSFVPSEGRRFEGGRERRVGFESTGAADAADNWGRKKEEDRKFGGGNGGAFDSLRERRGGGFDSNSNGGGPDSEAWGRRREESNGSGGGGARPRLNLQPRTLPLPRPETPPARDGQQNGTVVAAAAPSPAPSPAKPRSSNPFGAARPREEVLKEKYGDDWKQIDEKIELAKLKEKEEALQNERGSFGGRRGFGSGDGRRTPEGPPLERSWKRPGQDEFRPSSAGSVGKAETEASDIAAEDVQE